jgi:hypothetical protein
MSETQSKIFKNDQWGELVGKCNMVGCKLDSSGSGNNSEFGSYEHEHFVSHIKRDYFLLVE